MCAKRMIDEVDTEEEYANFAWEPSNNVSTWEPTTPLFDFVIGEAVNESQDASEAPETVEDGEEALLSWEELTDVVPEDEGRGVRRWCFTLNNYTAAECEFLKHWLPNHTDFHVVHKEVGEQGTPHLQGYFRLKSTATSKALHKKFGLKRASLFICKGTEAQNERYCKKSGPDTLFSRGGTMQAGQGARTDLKVASEKIRDGGMTAYRKLAREEPHMIVKYAKGFQHLMEAVDTPRKLDKPPEVIYFYGEAGAGKSVAAYKLADDLCKSRDVQYVEIDTGMLPFCDGYAGEKIVMFNDFRTKNHHGTDLQVDIFLKMLDMFPYRLNIKGSSRHLQADTFIFTNTQHPSKFFQDKGTTEPQKQWLRRITRVVRCVKKVIDGEEVYEQEECGNGEQPEIIPFIP